MNDRSSDSAETNKNEVRQDSARALNRRKIASIISIEPNFKRRQMARVLAFAGMYVALSTFVLGFFYVHIIHPDVVNSSPFYLDISDAGALWQRFPGLRTTVLIWATCMTGLSSIFAAAVGLHFSHKLAGPIYRFKLELQRISDGAAFRPIVLRKGDDFQDMADALNTALVKLESRARNSETERLVEAELDVYRDAYTTMERQIDRFDIDWRANLPADEAACLRELIDGLRASLSKCDTTGSMV